MNYQVDDQVVALINGKWSAFFQGRLVRPTFDSGAAAAKFLACLQRRAAERSSLGLLGFPADVSIAVAQAHCEAWRVKRKR